METRRFVIILAALVTLATAAATAFAMVPMTTKVAHTALPAVEVMECIDPVVPHDVVTVVEAGYEVAPVEPQDDLGDEFTEEVEEGDGYGDEGCFDASDCADADSALDTCYGEPLGTPADFRRDGVWKWNDDVYTWYSSNARHHRDTWMWWLDEWGMWRTDEGYLVVACDYRDYGEVFETPFGLAQVLDDGCEGVDCYVCW